MALNTRAFPDDKFLINDSLIEDTIQQECKIEGHATGLTLSACAKLLDCYRTLIVK